MGALILFGATVYLVLAGALLNSLDSTLTQRMHQVQGEVSANGGRLAVSNTEEETDVPAIPVVLITPNGTVVHGGLPADVRRWVTDHSRSFPRDLTLTTVGRVRLAAAPANENGRIIGYIVLWSSVTSIEEARETLVRVLLAAGLTLVVLAGVGGLLLARRALRPVSLLTHTASAISATDLRRRVPIGVVRDELSELAGTFNAMIDRLEAAVERERSFTSSASHELRSPLAVIRAEATLALEQPRTAESYRDAMERVDYQASVLEDLLAALLILARLESAGQQRDVVAVNDMVVAAVNTGRHAVDAPDVSVIQDIAPGVCVEGSAALLTRAIGNVVENALKVSTPGQTVDVRAEVSDEAVTVIVCDQGPGISAEHLERIFEPFYRICAARTPSTSHGLGLYICQRIVEAHGGCITVESSPGKGTCFQLRLPAGRS